MPQRKAARHPSGNIPSLYSEIFNKFKYLHAVLFFFALTHPLHAVEVKVNLFGQPCLLQGQLDESALKIIHEVSPDQAYPGGSLLGVSNEQIRASLKKIRAIKNLPQALDRYRERLGKRMEAQAAFLDGLDALRKTHKAAALLSGTKPFIQTQNGNGKNFEALARKIENFKGKPDPEITEQLYDAFSELIEQDPEEEFHRAIRRINVRYTCAFDESQGTQGTQGTQGSSPQQR